MSEDGSKYARFLFWHQHWVQTNNLAVEGGGLQLTHSVRRSRPWPTPRCLRAS